MWTLQEFHWVISNENMLTDKGAGSRNWILPVSCLNFRPISEPMEQMCNVSLHCFAIGGLPFPVSPPHLACFLTLPHPLCHLSPPCMSLPVHISHRDLEFKVRPRKYHQRRSLSISDKQMLWAILQDSHSHPTIFWDIKAAIESMSQRQQRSVWEVVAHVGRGGAFYKVDSALAKWNDWWRKGGWVVDACKNSCFLAGFTAKVGEPRGWSLPNLLSQLTSRCPGVQMLIHRHLEVSQRLASPSNHSSFVNQQLLPVGQSKLILHVIKASEHQQKFSFNF